MFKNKMLNSDIITTLSTLGHTDTITIADAGLPIYDEKQRIDLALYKGVPSFLDVLDSIKDEMVIEKVTIAKEIIENNNGIYNEINKRFKDIEIDIVHHSDFKELTKTSKKVVRTGECTPYANIILHSGVDFNGDFYE